MDWFYIKGILILSGINLMAVLGLSLLTGFTGLFPSAMRDSWP